MPPQTHEQTINTALGEVLHRLGREWRVSAELVGGLFEEGGRPDILVEKPDGWPIVIEAEVGNHTQAEIEAQSRLGNRLTTSAATVNTAVAVVYPEELRKHSGKALRKAIQSATYDHAIYMVGKNGETIRFPESGWLTGGVKDLAILLHRSSVPAWQVEALADSLEQGVNRAEGTLTAAHGVGSQVGKAVADGLGQSDDEDHQTRRMAMTVVADALIFHASLAEAEMKVPDRQTEVERNVKQPTECRSHGTFQPTQILDEWDSILEVDYWPIFHTAGSILRVLPTQTAAKILDELWQTAEQLIAGGVTKSHDLTGIVFQRLIADRKFLATFYTRPAAAALLAGLAMPTQRPLVGSDWSDQESLSRVRIGDFACGTGTLLSTAYQRLGLLHEVNGGDPKRLHPTMMQRGLVGLDVLNVAVHLTAAMLAGSHPDTPFEGECLLTMPYGPHDWGVSLGSLDLLEQQTSFDIIQAAARTAGGRGEEEVVQIIDRVGHGHFDLVIMNPPFTRHGAHEGDRIAVHNPAFAAFDASEEEQNLLAARLRQLAEGGCAHGHAGLASYFVDLAHRKTADGGTIALVLPMSAMSGMSWDAVRNLWRDKYSSLIITTIAEESTHTRSFSADTGMAECLVTAVKRRPDGVPRAVFAILSRQPATTLEGILIATAISTAVTTGNVRTLEGGPFGGTRILLGDTSIGEILDSPLPTDGAWQTVGIRDLSLAQSAFQLANGRLWIEGMPESGAHEVAIARIADIADRIGPHHLDICGAQIKADGLPQGPFEKIDEPPPPGAAYPCLWNHNSEAERKLIVPPDSHCRVREVGGRVPQALASRADARWETASRVHYNLDLQFNSQSLIVAATEHPSIGGRAWPTVVFGDTDQEFAFLLWSNSTLGLLCHWWMSNKTQAGRGTTTITGIPHFSTLDVRALSAQQHAAAREAYNDLSNGRFLPFDQIDEDPARAELDRRLLVDVLGLHPSLCAPGGPMHRLRQKLAIEPQIHASKQTRVVFTEEGEENVRRAVAQ